MVKKKKKKTVNKKPNWVGDIDLSFCEPGLVYNIYQCRKCILEYKEDQARSCRKKSVKIPGLKKKQVVEVCQCREPLLIKYKKCPCGQEYWGFYLRENKTCKECGAYDLNNMSKGRNYYRLGQFYKYSSIDISDPERWDCLSRKFCLEVTFVHGSKKGIGCLDCPDYEKSKL